MKFSNVDVIGKQLIMNHNKKHEKKGFWTKLIKSKEPEYTFSFYTPKDIYNRSLSLCHDVEMELAEGEEFTISDLARALYTDFINFVRDSNDFHDTYKRLKTRDFSPTIISPYSTEEVYDGVIFEEVRGFEIVETKICHRDALRGEYHLKDMLLSYPEHGYILEHVLEIVFYNFVDNYRKCLIKNPIDKILHYW